MNRSALALTALIALLPVTAACGGDRAAPEPEEQATAGPGAESAETAAPAGEADAVARVNGVDITARELEMSISNFLQNQGMPSPPAPEQADRIRGIVLNALIGRELIYQHSVETDVRATEQEVKEAMEKTRGAFPTEEAWTAHLTGQGITEAEAEERLARSLAIDKVIQEQVVAKTDVSEEEIRRYYDENPEQMQRPEEVRASHILIRAGQEATEEERARARERASELLARARGGADFTALARESSEDPASAQRGGDLGFFARGRMVPPFEAAAFALAVNQVSDVVETSFGYHVIKVTDRHDAGKVPFEEVSEKLGQFLKQRSTNEDIQQFVKDLRDAAEVELL